MPVSFEVYCKGKRAADFEPVAAYVVGPESVPMPGEVANRDGVLVLSRSDEIPMGLSLLWDAGAAGRITWRRRGLAPRDRPYILNVELARFRLMKVLQKQEDWSLFDFPKADRFISRFGDPGAVCRSAVQAGRAGGGRDDRRRGAGGGGSGCRRSWRCSTATCC